MGNLKTLGVEKITAVDPDPERLKPAVDELGVFGSPDLVQALRTHPDVVLICTPPALHIEQCLAAVHAGAHVFVEKPLTNSLKDIDELAGLAREKKRIVQVGYNLRFIPALQALKALVHSRELGHPLWARFEFGQYLPDWRPWQDYRQGYTARKELGGGIILDASHEIDLALWLLGKPIELCCMAGKTSDLQMDVEDTATLLLRFESGAQADIHVDCVQREYSRGIKISFEKGTASWSWPENVLRLFSVDTGERIYPAGDYLANQMYVDELNVFLTAVVGGTKEDSLEEGRRVVHVALSALRSAEQRTWEKLG
jgi:predicted dehydrogenase